MTQAEITRHVKAALKAARDMGFTVTGYKITFAQGVPCVEVTTGPESPLPAPVQTGGDNVQALKARIGRLHEGNITRCVIRELRKLCVAP